MPASPSKSTSKPRRNRSGKYELLAHEGGTKLRFSESSFGHVTEAEMASKDHGWSYLYDDCLRAHLEGGEPPAWQDAPASSC